jgi:hypothetical protein
MKPCLEEPWTLERALDYALARIRRAEAESDERIAIAALRKALALPQLDFRQTGQ